MNNIRIDRKLAKMSLTVGRWRTLHSRIGLFFIQ